MEYGFDTNKECLKAFYGLVLYGNKKDAIARYHRYMAAIFQVVDSIDDIRLTSGEQITRIHFQVSNQAFMLEYQHLKNQWYLAWNTDYCELKELTDDQRILDLVN